MKALVGGSGVGFAAPEPGVPLGLGGRRQKVLVSRCGVAPSSLRPAPLLCSGPAPSPFSAGEVKGHRGHSRQAAGPLKGLFLTASECEPERESHLAQVAQPG